MGNYFTHPSNVCMSYLEHAKLSLKFAYLFFIAFIKAIIHAILPDYFITSTTDTVKHIENILQTVGCRKGLKNENN